MKDYQVRIAEITIKNFKNVVYGTVSLDNPIKDYKASILGLYGQNGSGKTALIDVLEVLKYALCGLPLPSKFSDCINVDADEAKLEYKFNLISSDECVDVYYEVSIRSVIADSQLNWDKEATSSTRKIVLLNEIIKCPILSKKSIKIGRLIDSSSDIFTPVAKKNLLVGKDKDSDMDLVVAKRVSYKESRSFVFSRELLEVIRNRNDRNELNKEDEEELFFYSDIIENLVEFGNHGLFVINASTIGLISLNTQPISFKYRGKEEGAIGTIMLPLDGSEVVPKPILSIIKSVITNMNIVLEKIVPGLTIGVKEMGGEVLPNGDEGCRIELLSLKNSKEIPLKNESDGIKKIISILQLLIVVYNQSSITVAIDELDSGVFEYLLGEILKIISEKGKGQLIFTSHNLRPLETLDKTFIAFTTTNPSNRYIRMSNVKETNNLRDFYYRDITLGGQKEELYIQTKNSEIALAFRKAGMINGT